MSAQAIVKRLGFESQGKHIPKRPRRGMNKEFDYYHYYHYYEPVF